MDTIVGELDKTEIPPLNQKRILAFVNHFLVSTCTFLNEFALGCETKFVQMERQLQKTEASLLILEAKLASIPIEEGADEEAKPTTVASKSDSSQEEDSESECPSPPEPAGVRACEDLRYRKFFKMLHVGVPAPAIKIKMQSEGLESRILDTPDLILADGILE